MRAIPPPIKEKSRTKSYRKELVFSVDRRRQFLNITLLVYCPRKWRPGGLRPS